MASSRQLLAMCSVFEEFLNDPELKAVLDLPSTIQFQVTPLEGTAGSLPLKITAVGTGFSTQALYGQVQVCG